MERSVATSPDALWFQIADRARYVYCEYGLATFLSTLCQGWRLIAEIRNHPSDSTQTRMTTTRIRITGRMRMTWIMIQGHGGCPVPWARFGVEADFDRTWGGGHGLLVLCTRFIGPSIYTCQIRVLGATCSTGAYWSMYVYRIHNYHAQRAALRGDLSSYLTMLEMFNLT